MTAIKNLWPLLLVVSATALQAQTPHTSLLVPVVSRQSARIAELPGEFAPLLSVSLHAKVPGFVEKVLVDRGSVVKEGQLVAELSAPEMTARIAEAESKLQAAESELSQAEAQLAAAQSTSEKLKAAAATPGAIAGNELIVAEKETDAARALVNSRHQATHAAQA
jgi:multidrug efflux pump subunit AcrA (membrane-fusion protein)